MSRSPASVAASWIIVGIFIFQLGWMFAVRPFAGIDEFDHAYRAASVARGHWSPDLKQSELGRGDLIRVPSDIVDAAALPCMDLPYTGLLNCHAASWPNQDGDVLVASAAARYNPLYYAIVGAPALAFEGASALYAMRLTSIALCDLLLFATILIALKMGRSIWPAATVLTAVTPVMLYATANTAPNGAHLSAGLLMWTSALALTHARSERSDRLLVSSLSIAVAIVLTLHTTGPLWVLLTAMTLAFLPRFRTKVVSVWKTQRRFLLLNFAAIVAVGLLDLTWITTRRTNMAGDDGDFGALGLSDLLISMPLWVFQTIGSIPFRNEYVPTPVFGILLVVFLLLYVLALIKGSRAERGVLGGITVLFFAVPSGLTYMTYDALGVAWQGRYALPYACGILLLSGWVLDREGLKFRLAPALIGVSVFGFGVAQSIATVSVMDRQETPWPVNLDPPFSPLWITAVACGLATVVTCAGMGRAAKTTRSGPAVAEGPLLKSQLVHR